MSESKPRTRSMEGEAPEPSRAPTREHHMRLLMPLLIRPPAMNGVRISGLPLSILRYAILRYEESVEQEITFSFLHRHKTNFMHALPPVRPLGIRRRETLCQCRHSPNQKVPSADRVLSCYSHSMPPSDAGEWWELQDEGRENMPYYYHTKTGETVWTRPDGFVIPLGIIQVRLPRLHSINLF